MKAVPHFLLFGHDTFTTPAYKVNKLAQQQQA